MNIRFKILFIIFSMSVIVCNFFTDSINGIFLILCCLFIGYFVFKNNKNEINSEENNSENQDIIATITHDLKTPAIAQINALELLLKGNYGEVTEPQKTFIKDILDSSNNMLNMLLNLLWLYKVDNKKLEISLCQFDIYELIKDIFYQNHLYFHSKNHKFEFYINHKYKYIYADKMHISKIITNLVINAVTYSKKDSIIRIETSTKKNDFIFRITNFSSFAIDEMKECINNRNKVFTQKTNGLSTGLGLYLSNKLLLLNKGKFYHYRNKEGFNTFGFILKQNNKSKNVNEYLTKI